MGLLDWVKEKVEEVKEKVDKKVKRALWKIEEWSGRDITGEGAIGEPLPVQKVVNVPKNASVAQIIEAAKKAATPETELGRKKVQKLREVEKQVAEAVRSHSQALKQATEAEKTIAKSREIVEKEIQNVLKAAGVKSFAGHTPAEIAKKLEARGIIYKLRVGNKEITGEEAIKFLIKTKWDLAEKAKEVKTLKSELAIGPALPSGEEILLYGEKAGYFEHRMEKVKELDSALKQPMKTGFIAMKGYEIAERITKYGEKFGEFVSKPYLYLAEHAPLPKRVKEQLELQAKVGKHFYKGAASLVGGTVFTLSSIPLVGEMATKSPKAVKKFLITGAAMQAASTAAHAIKEPVEFLAEMAGAAVASEVIFSLPRTLKSRFKVKTELQKIGVEYNPLKNQIKLPKEEAVLNKRIVSASDLFKESKYEIKEIIRPAGEGKIVDAVSLFEAEKYSPKAVKVLIHREPIYGKIVKFEWKPAKANILHETTIVKTGTVDVLSHYERFYGRSLAPKKIIEKIERGEPLGYRITEVELGKKMNPLRIKKYTELELEISSPIRAGGKPVPLEGGGGRIPRQLGLLKQLMKIGEEEIMGTLEMASQASRSTSLAMGLAASIKREAKRIEQINSKLMRQIWKEEQKVKLLQKQLQKQVSGLKEMSGMLQIEKVSQDQLILQETKNAQKIIRSMKLSQELVQSKVQKTLQKQFQIEEIKIKDLTSVMERKQQNATRTKKVHKRKMSKRKSKSRVRVAPTPKIDPMYQLFTGVEMSKSQVRVWRKLYEANPLWAGLIPEALPKRRRRRK